MSKYKLVEVYCVAADTWYPRNAILFNSNGSVLVIAGIDKQLDDNFIATSSTYYPQYREIQQPTWKPFPDNESMEHLKDCWFRNKGETQQFKVESYDSGCDYDSDVFIINGEWWSINDVFKYLEVQLNGKWQPVGVEEC